MVYLETTAEDPADVDLVGRANEAVRKKEKEEKERAKELSVQQLIAEKRGNAADVGNVLKDFEYETNAYTGNIFHDVAQIGVFEKNGYRHVSLESFQKSMAEKKPLVSDVGIEMKESVLRDPENKDFRTKAGEKVVWDSVITGAAFKTPQIHDSHFVLEAYAKVEQASRGVLLEKKDEKAGYALTVDEAGHLLFSIRYESKDRMLRSTAPVADGAWHHILAECDSRDGMASDEYGDYETKLKTLRLYIDGKKVALLDTNVEHRHSLANESDVYVGGTPEGQHLRVTLEYMRIGQGTLEEAQTSIEELYAWQFDGPFLRDFVGRKPHGKGRDAGALEALPD